MRISVVTTMYFSEPYIKRFYELTANALKSIEIDDYEILFVNDGSPDNSLHEVLQLQKQDHRIIAIDLSKNFGHHKAIIAGLSQASGEFIFLIDCDLEEDPGILNELWGKMIQAENSADVVYGIQEKRKGNFSERAFGLLFYRMLSFLANVEYPADTLTARLMKKEFVQAVLLHKEKSLDVWGIFVLTGYKQVAIKARKGFKGRTTYTLSKKVAMAIDIITSLSNKPLMIIALIGLFILVISFLYIIYIIANAIIFEESRILGWNSIIASIWFVGGMIIFMLGIISVYISKLFIEVKNRPLYIIKSIFKKD